MIATNTGTINLSFTIIDFLLAVLLILGILVLYNLVKVLSSLVKVSKSVEVIVEDNKDALSESLAKTPSIAKSTDEILIKSNNILTDVEPDIKEALSGLKDTAKNAGKISNNLSDTVDFVSLSTIDTVDNLSNGVVNITDYIAILKELFQTVRNYLGK